MQKIELGNTGFLISRIVYGGVLSMDEGQEASNRYTAYAIEQGVNYFDVAPSYGDGQEMLGNSLIPYRRDVYLACKTTARKKADALMELEQSLKHLHTDYLDNYQLHAVTSVQDVETAFGPGGTMEMMRDMKEKGVIRKLGVTAHNEQAALECLRRFPFDTVMFPLNWMLHKREGIGEEISKAAQNRGIGLLGIKAMIDRAWKDESERKLSLWPKSWCKPIDMDQTELRLSAMKYAFHLGANALVPPGNYESFSFMAEHADECVDHPLDEADIKLLAAHFPLMKDQPFFTQDNAPWRKES